MKNLEVSDDDLKKHLFNFFPSLRQYPKEYLSLILINPIEIPEHMAYLCPLCLKNFIYYVPTQLIWSESFSLDHFPPEDLKGKHSVLVCKPCNNNAGSLYEAQLKEIVERECFNKKVANSTINSKVTISDVRGWHSGKFSINENEEYTFELATNQIKNLPELADWQNKPVGAWKMNATIKDTDEVKLAKSLLKATYLYCFYQWGYSFVFSESGKLLRDAIKEPSTYPIKIPSIWLDNKSPNVDLKSITPGVIFISEPKEFQSIFVNIPLELVHLNYKCIIPIQIPSPVLENIKKMQEINDNILAQQIITMKIAPINFPHPGMEDSFSYTWSSLLNQFNT